jgi:hypothetical protein
LKAFTFKGINFQSGGEVAQKEERWLNQEERWLNEEERWLKRRRGGSIGGEVAQ